MTLPSEYVIEDAVRSIDDIIVYRAEHPIHGTVNVYLPDEALPVQFAQQVRKRLYRDGLQMRNISLRDIGFVTKALEVSQNPNEPYIVTRYAKHDLEEFISNGVVIKPKRMYMILRQVLEATVNLASNGLLISRFHPRQIKLSQLHSGDISLNVIEGAEQQYDGVESAVDASEGKNRDSAAMVPVQRDFEKDKSLEPTVKISEATKQVQEDKESQKGFGVEDSVNRTATIGEGDQVRDAQKFLRTIQRNIYLFGNMTYQLLFGRSYQANDKVAAANIKRLGRRWRKILERSLNEDIDRRYNKYESMLQDVKKAVNRNRRMAVASIPFLLILLAVGCYFAYERYHRYKIMTSEAGQAIKSFLDIVNKTEDEIVELKRPEPSSPVPDEQAILSPFNKIEAAE